MIFEISKKHASLLFKAIRDAEDFAKSLNIDLYNCHIEFHNNILCKDIMCYLICFYEKEILDRDWMGINNLNDVCVYISKENKQTILITQSR